VFIDDTCEIVLRDYRMLTIGLGGAWNFMFSFRQWTKDDTKGQSGGTTHWRYLRSAGDRRNLVPNRPYNLEVSVQGSVVTLIVDGVEVGGGIAPFQLNRLQTGIFCIGSSDIHIRNFTV